MITKETFQRMSQDCKLDVLYDISTDIYKEVKKTKKTDSTLSAIFGFIGGLVAVLGSKIFRG